MASIVANEQEINTKAKGCQHEATDTVKLRAQCQEMVHGYRAALT